MKPYKQMIMYFFIFLSVVRLGSLFSEGYSGWVVLSVLILTIISLYVNYEWACGKYPNIVFWQACLWNYIGSFLVIYIYSLDISIKYDKTINDVFSLFIDRNLSVFILPMFIVPISLLFWSWICSEVRQDNTSTDKEEYIRNFERDNHSNTETSTQQNECENTYKKWAPLDFITINEHRQFTLNNGTLIDYAFHLCSRNNELSVNDILRMAREEVEIIKSIMSPDMEVDFDKALLTTLIRIKAN